MRMTVQLTRGHAVECGPPLANEVRAFWVPGREGEGVCRGACGGAVSGRYSEEASWGGTDAMYCRSRIGGNGYCVIAIKRVK